MPQGTQARGRSSWPSGDDYTFFSLMVIAGGLAIYGWLAWTYYHAEISRAFAMLAHWHIAAIHGLTDDFDSLDRQLLSADYHRVTLKGINAAATAIGIYFRIPAAVLLGVLAVLCFVRSPSTRYTRRLDLDGLIAEQAGSFRTIAAFATRKLRLAALPPGDPRPAAAGGRHPRTGTCARERRSSPAAFASRWPRHTSDWKRPARPRKSPPCSPRP